MNNYNQLFIKTNIKMSKAQCHYVKLSERDEERLMNGDKTVFNKTKYINKHWKYGKVHNKDWKRGDVILTEEDPYRNNGKYMWDGNKAISLDYDTTDDYGSIPREFLVGKEFLALHWVEEDYNGFSSIRFNNLIDHNAYVFASFNDEISELVNTKYREFMENPIKERKSYYEPFTTIKFSYNDHEWCIKIMNYRENKKIFNNKNIGIFAYHVDVQHLSKSNYTLYYYGSTLDDELDNSDENNNNNENQNVDTDEDSDDTTDSDDDTTNSDDDEDYTNRFTNPRRCSDY